MDVTVEEAAHRLGVSVATVRRRLSTGGVSGRKVGKQWIVDGDKLPSPSPGRGAAGAATALKLDIKTAFDHIRSTDLNEIWVPDVLRWEDYAARPNELLAEASARATTPRCDAATEIDVPKTPILTRAAVLLTIEDRVAYQALIASFAHEIEALLPDSVYSSRRATSGRWFFKKGTKQWVAWRKAVHDEVDSAGPWLVKTDLTAFFDTVDHATLLGELQNLGVHPKVLAALRHFLATWSLSRARGIPTGPNASRALGNFFLLPIDRTMISAGYNYWRYMDDVRIVAPSKFDAVAAIRLFERECRKRGLIVSAQKTELLTGDAAIKEGDDPQRQIAQYLFDANQSAQARAELRKIFKSSVKGDGHVDVGRAKFSLWRLARLLDRGALRQLLLRLEDFGPIASISAAYLRTFLSRAEVQSSLSDFLDDPTRNTSPLLETWLMACMLEFPGVPPSAWTSRARRITRDRNIPNYAREISANVMVLQRDPQDIAWLKGELVREYDPELIRGYATALARVKALDKSTSRALASRVPALTVTLEYLQNRSTLPSLVYRGNYVALR